MRIQLLLILGLLCGLCSVNAQEGLPFYEHYLVSDPFLINPSYAGANPEVLKFRASHRSQWSGFDDAPSTQIISGHTTVVNRLAVGAYVFNDRNGASNLTGGNIAAAYHIPVGGENYKYENTENLFSFGLGYNGFQQHFDRTKWNAANPNDPLLEEDTYFLSYFNLGLSFNYNGVKAGVSVLDIPLGDNRPIVNAIEPLPTIYYFTLGYDYMLADGITLKPSILFNLNSNSERQLDLNFQSKFDLGQNALTVGVNYRTDSDVSGSQTLRLSPILNFEIGRLNIGYAYGMGLSDIAKEAGKGHLISLGFDLGNPFDVYRR